MGKSTIDIEKLLEFHHSQFGSARMSGPPPVVDPPPAPAPPAPTPPAPAPTPPTPPANEKTLTQSQVNDIVATRTTEAKNKAMEDLAKDLGVPIEDAKRIVKERQDADAKNQTELERSEAARKAAESDRDDKVSAKDLELHAERADRQLIAAGAEDDDAKLERLRGMLTVKPGASKDDVKADVEKLKKDFPALFAEQAPPTRRTSSDPPRKPGGGKVSDTAYQRGLDRAAARSGREKASDDNRRVDPLPIPGMPT